MARNNSSPRGIVRRRPAKNVMMMPVAVAFLWVAALTCWSHSSPPGTSLWAVTAMSRPTPDRSQVAARRQDEDWCHPSSLLSKSSSRSSSSRSPLSSSSFSWVTPLRGGGVPSGGASSAEEADGESGQDGTGRDQDDDATLTGSAEPEPHDGTTSSAETTRSESNGNEEEKKDDTVNIEEVVAVGEVHDASGNDDHTTTGDDNVFLVLEEANATTGTESGGDGGTNNNNADDGSGVDSVTEIATRLRLEGKAYHDQGDFIRAAGLFQQAADTLRPQITTMGGEDDADADAADSTRPTTMLASMVADYATCRLHQALCHLKSEQYDLCIEACTDVLQDGGDGEKVEQDDDDNDNDNASRDDDRRLSSIVTDSSPAVRARAYHRRAKAKLALGDTTGALHDARTAAFLGDGKAVAFYGKLMRGDSSGSSYDSSLYSNSPLNSWLSPQESSSSSLSSTLPNHSALLESLMKKSSSRGVGGDSTGLPDFSPLSLLMGSNNGSGGGGNGMLGALGSGGGDLAKSVLASLAKRLDEEATQIKISNFLKNTNKAQLTTLAVMAGVDGAAIQDSPLVDRLIGVCNRVTPRTIRRTVRTTKVTVYIVRIIRKVLKLIDKYKSLLAALLILQWAKSATLRPIPINAKAARKAAKEALKQAMKSNRG